MRTANDSVPWGVSLRRGNLRDLKAGIRVPTYPREMLTPAWVHIGVGGFHRAHQALYLDDLAEQQGIGAWVSWVLDCPQDKRMEQALVPQECLYTLVERNAEADNARVIGSLCRYLFAPEHGEETLRTLAGPETRIVSLTITEGGYNFNQVTGEFEAGKPRHSGGSGALVHACHRLRLICEALIAAARLGSHRSLSCRATTCRATERWPGRVIVAFAELRDRNLADWISTHVAFPNCMVDTDNAPNDRRRSRNGGTDLRHSRCLAGDHAISPVGGRGYLRQRATATRERGRPVRGGCPSV